jgi:two-component system CheB/CheR fusion protein
MSEDRADDTTTGLSSRRAGQPCTVVGVGASSGGLAATTELLRHLGPSPGVALVVIHHLDPTHESGLAEIFGRVTPLAVHTAEDGMRVEVDHVYVLPPNATLLLVDGVLRLTSRVQAAGSCLPVDRFLESLATDRTCRAACVLLTGTGSDGALGVQAVKAEGGVTFAQDASAEYPGMPESAIATGCVDFVLPPEGIARQLVRIGQCPDVPPAELDDERDKADFHRVLVALRKATAVDFANYKLTTIGRRLRRRLAIHGLSSLREYADLVERSPGEAASLRDEILIHVTSFFRDSGAFEVLKATVLPKLLDQRPRHVCIRVWVPGCSTGEEVYSLAMTILEFLTVSGAEDVPLKLFGTDVSQSAIDRARDGWFPATIEQDVSPDRLRRFFVKQPAAYQIRRGVRDACVFAQHDATRDPPFSGMDLVSCRNLMIYLGPVLQDRVLPNLHFALKEPGFLLLGASETIRTFPGFKILDAQNKIYARTSATPRVVFSSDDAPFSDRVFARGEPMPSGPQNVHREADRLVLAEFAPAGVVVTDDLAIVQFRGKTGPFLEPAPGVASFELFRMVKEALRAPLRQVIDAARATQAKARSKGVLLGPGSLTRTVEIEAIPFGVASTSQRFFVVLFREQASTLCGQAPATPDVTEAPSDRETRLVGELASSRDYLESVIEQLEASNEELRAANEEVISSNEELRATNEELQMAKEELHASNEELRTLNDELTARDVEATRLNDDLANLLGSVEIPILVLDRESRLRRFTPAAARVLGVTGRDLGRVLRDLSPILSAAHLAQMTAEVLDRLGPVNRAVQDVEGRWYDLTVRAYRTMDHRIDGTVVSLFDIDAAKKAEERVAHARDFAESVLDTVREGLVVLDRDLRVRSVNRTFCDDACVAREAIEGRFFHEIGRGEWNLAGLRGRLAELGDGEGFEGLRAVQQTATGSRVFMLNARNIALTPLLLLALEDVTERERAEDAARRAEVGVRDMLSTLATGVVGTDPTGKIVWVNRTLERACGYEPDEVVGVPFDALLVERQRAMHGAKGADFWVTKTAKVFERVFRRKDGTEFPAECYVGPLETTDGSHAVVFVRDITERKDADRQLHDYQTKLQEMSFDLTLAQERERRRIATELHDRVGQSLALAQIKLSTAREAMTGEGRDAVDYAVKLLVQSIEDTRALTFELCPPVLYELGLDEALGWLVEDVQKRYGMQVALEHDGVHKPLDDAVAWVVFRAVRELLVNIFKHAKTPEAKVSLRARGSDLELEVEDQGVGFDATIGAGSPGKAGFGLFSVREQIARLGGTVDVASEPGRGTRVSLRVGLKPRDG